MTAEELRARVIERFLANVENNEKINAIFQKIQDGGTYADAEDFAWNVGGALSEALCSVEGELPEAVSREFADTLLRDALQRDHTLVSEAAYAVQESLNKGAGIGLKAVRVKMNADRVDGLVNKLASYEEVIKGFWLFDAPVRNFSQSVVDDTLRANAEFRHKAGLRPRIIRKNVGDCCEWCAKLAGTYDYPNVPKDVYRRHERCRCTVDYDPGDRGGLRQNVWTKEWTSRDERAKIEARKQVGQNAFIDGLVEHPVRLGAYTPASLQQEFEKQGYTVTALSQGHMKGIPFEQGGGYKVHFSGNGLFMYHPEERSHHGGAYFKISTAKGGVHHYDVTGKEFDPNKKTSRSLG